MTEETISHSDDMKDRRQQRGTWPWFALNVVLFPAPAHFTLLRVKDFRFGRSIIHLSITVLLTLILLASASFQVIFPVLGHQWMLFPVLSGLIVLCIHFSLKKDFKPFDITVVTKIHLSFFLFLVAIFTAISILPDLDFIELNQKQQSVYQSWLIELPYWQDLLILLAALILIFVAYLTNTNESVSINRALILYACFFVFMVLLSPILLLAFDWLKIRGGFSAQLAFTLLCAILAVDYWNASSFGQYTRRFFFLTCTKGLYFMILWFSFFGLPQKVVATISGYYFNQSKPPVIKDFQKYLVFSDRDRFQSAHQAGHRIRALYARALYHGSPDELNRVTALLNANRDVIFPTDADFYRLADLVNENKLQATPEIFDKMPLFRPVHPEWDVMLTALLMQETISKTELNNYIADFKSNLPKSSQGNLPRINTSNRAQYVSLATHTQVDFVPPRFEFFERLYENNFCPVLSLRLAGKNYWAALLHIDRQSEIAWFRVETLSDIEKPIQVLFDANKSGNLKDEIFSRLMIPLSLAYLRDTLEQYSETLIVFSQSGLENDLPEMFTAQDLEKMDGAVAFASSAKWATAPVFTGSQDNIFSDYAEYLCNIALIKAMLVPTPYKQDLFFPVAATTTAPNHAGRFEQINTLLGQVGPLRDCDRADIAYLMVAQNHVNGAPDLFIRLTTEKMIPSDLIDCQDTFLIGQKLFLLGFHEKAYRYLKIAFLRHPFFSDNEMWFHIVREKLKEPPIPFYSPPDHQPDLYLYYRTLADLHQGREKTALKRLEKAMGKDAHDSLVSHLLSKYFNKPLNERHFFPAQEGL